MSLTQRQKRILIALYMFDDQELITILNLQRIAGLDRYPGQDIHSLELSGLIEKDERRFFLTITNDGSEIVFEMDPTERLSIELELKEINK